MGLSALLNLLFIALLIYENYKWQADATLLAAAPPPVEVDLMPPPPPPPPAAKAQQQPPPQAEKQPEKKEAEKEPEKQPEKQPEKPPEKPPEKQPEKQPQKQPDKQQALARPLPPQLLQSQIKDKSATDRKDAHNGANGEDVAIALLGNGPMIQLLTKDESKAGPEGSRGPIGEELSQTEQDYILSQILPFWKVDTHRPEGKGMVLQAIIEIRADGTLMSPLNRDDPWNPAAVIVGYGDLARLGYSYRRESMEGFLLALRLSQPLKLPPGGKWPKWMRLRFSFDDL